MRITGVDVMRTLKGIIHGITHLVDGGLCLVEAGDVRFDDCLGHHRIWNGFEIKKHPSCLCLHCLEPWIAGEVMVEEFHNASRIQIQLCQIGVHVEPNFPTTLSELLLRGAIDRFHQFKCPDT